MFAKVFYKKMKYLTTKYMGFGDGTGSQIHRRVSVWTYCKLNNVKYVHTPFFTMEHNYEKDEAFENKWENFFNLGYGELQLNEVKVYGGLDNSSNLNTIIIPINKSYQKRTMNCCPGVWKTIYQSFLMRFS